MRKRGRVDNTQAPIVDALRKIGANVAVTSALGNGFPDVVWSYHGVTGMLELKTGNEKLTAAEMEFHAKWNARIPIVRTPEQAQLAVINAAMGARA